MLFGTTRLRCCPPVEQPRYFVMDSFEVGGGAVCHAETSPPCVESRFSYVRLCQVWN